MEGKGAGVVDGESMNVSLLYWEIRKGGGEALRVYVE